MQPCPRARSNQGDISAHQALVLARAKRVSFDTIGRLGDASKVRRSTRPTCSTRAPPSEFTAEFDKQPRSSPT
ncbi:hypothetical protein H9P43_009670 [Blastocladiella emersonii ATCC 22665]|nr:hypothetical protein H9P43_009670 [Blastocladiella emersonii ATCC 22665]